MTEETKLNIYQRINEVRKAVGFVVKDRSVSTGQGSYKAVTHDQVTGVLRNAMIEHGIVCVPTLESSVMNTPMVDVDGKQAKQSRYDAIYIVAFINIDNPDDAFPVRIESHAMDNADKAPGKALSYAVKYALLKVFNLETGENEEERYQKGEIDIAFHVDKMMSAENMEELRERYKVSVELALDVADKAAMKAFGAARDKKKAELGKAAS